METESSIKVAIRSRPLSSNELNQGSQTCVIFPEDKPNEIIFGDSKCFTFDYGFDANVSQQEIYNKSIKSLIQNLFIGYNVTVLAYGQTGSGKTYTMGTNCNDTFITESTGVIPRAINDIFSYVNDIRSTNEVIMTTSFIEIYNEEIYDLLSECKEIRQIREENENVKIMNLIEAPVYNTEDIFTLLTKGGYNRATGSTAMNEQSSRSHAIFTIHININPINGTDQEPVFAKLHLVDLAGSEKASKTKACGDRFKEGVNINTSLFVLGRVISLLVEKEKNKKVHVPYRDSKLTRILQDSLGGNTKTFVMACISPADVNLDETQSTLNYAARARQIQNKPLMNRIDPAAGELYRLRSQVTALKSQLKRYEQQNSVNDQRHSYNTNKEVFGDTSYNMKKSMESQHALVQELKSKSNELMEERRNHFQLQTLHQNYIVKIDEHTKNLFSKIREKQEYYEDFEEINNAFSSIQEILGTELCINNDDLDDDDDEQADDKEETEDTDDENNKESMMSNSNEKEIKRKTLKQPDLFLLKDALMTAQQKYEDTVIEHKETLLKEHELRQKLNSLLEEGKKNTHEVSNSHTNRQLQQTKRDKERKAAEIEQLKLQIQQFKSKIIRFERDLKQERTSHKREMADVAKKFKNKEQQDRKLIIKMEKDNQKIIKAQVVLKRKLDTKVAEEKRLKELLAKRQEIMSSKSSRFQSHRQEAILKPVSQEMKNHILQWIKTNMDMIDNQVEIKKRYDNLMEERSLVNTELNELSMVTEEDELKSEELQKRLTEINNNLTEIQPTLVEDNYHNNSLMNMQNHLKSTNDYNCAVEYLYHELITQCHKAVENDFKLEEIRQKVMAYKEENDKLKEDNDGFIREKLRRHKSRRSSILLPNNEEEIISSKRQRKTYDVSDSDSVASRKSRISNCCRCKSFCRHNRCGCVKNGIACGVRCACKGTCANNMINTVIVEDPSDEENANKENNDMLQNEEIESVLNVTMDMDTEDSNQNDQIIKPEIFSDNEEVRHELPKKENTVLNTTFTY